MKKGELVEEIYSEIKDSYNSNKLLELVVILIDIMSLKIDAIELAGIEDRQYMSFSRIFDSTAHMSEIKVCLANVTKIEPLLKKILYLVNETQYQSIQNTRGGLIRVINALSLNPNNKNLDVSNPQIYSSESGYIEYVSRTYILRNSESHTYESWSRSKIFENIKSIIITCIRAIEINKNDIVSKLKEKTIDNELQIDTYLNGLCTEFRQRMSRFIHIRSEENFSVIGSYVVERQNDEADKIGRKGTVEYLRDNQIPERRMMIWGEAGIGKSTTLEYLVYTDALKRLRNKNVNIPVLFLLGIMTDSTYTIKQYICDKLDISLAVCESLLSEGKINLFLDGLNEIPSVGGMSLKTVRLREIKELIKKYPKTFIIISNRPQESKDFNNMPIFNLIKLSSDEIKDFLNKNVSELKIRLLLENAINADKRLENIVSTPLILSRLIEIVKFSGEIPKSEGAIIAEFLNCLLLREKEEKQDAELDIKKIKYLLSVIGYESLEYKEANSGMTESEILKYCAKCMDTYRFSYDAIYAITLSVQLGILEKRENMYVFAHQAYQDYYHALEEMAVITS